MADLYGNINMALVGAAQGTTSPEYRAAEQAWLTSKATPDTMDRVAPAIIAAINPVMGALVYVGQQQEQAEARAEAQAAVERWRAEDLPGQQARQAQQFQELRSWVIGGQASQVLPQISGAMSQGFSAAALLRAATMPEFSKRMRSAVSIGLRLPRRRRTWSWGVME